MWQFIKYLMPFIMPQIKKEKWQWLSKFPATSARILSVTAVHCRSYRITAWSRPYARQPPAIYRDGFVAVSVTQSVHVCGQ